MKRALFPILALVGCGWTAAETEAEDVRLERLEAAYNRAKQERQAVQEPPAEARC